MLTYLLFFIGIVLLGDIMLIPLIYFAVSNSLSLPSVLAVGILAKTAGDTMWYWAGTYFKKEKIYRYLMIDKLQKNNPEFFANFDQKTEKILFASNFIHGIRVPIRVMCGITRMSFKTFIKINLVGSFLWLMLIAGFAYTLNVSAEELEIYVGRGEIVLTILSVLFIVSQIFANKFAKKFFRNAKD